ncbi:MAG: flagellar basal body P-ring formation protein FlgA [Marinospirillum sp.]|uniref:flagellar basal body P-ring formation chaperone FlgA n=1 Tax=Marinospirillum sp. TaxID=2183934 RepID=UPI001A05392F|nr:flagellar basal body P-ring formation chaperone FlgA [Marinospirillum sp.]MBE0505991.1 flagellar basal body P-ring formation protein FlgA [Marinospirillum sp.]
MSAKSLSVYGLFMVLFSWVLPSFAQNQNVAQLQVDASYWIDQQLSGQMGRYEVQFSALDPRLRLAACQTPVDIEPHGGGELRGRVNLKISCLDQGWFVYLAVDIQRFVPVVVARTALPRGTGLTPQVLMVQEMEVSRVRGDYYTSINSLNGMQLRNRVRAGDVITHVNLMAADAVNKGEQVVISAISSTGSLGVRMAGEALDNGKIGDQIRVRNIQSGRVIRAIVKGRGAVEVRF